MLVRRSALAAALFATLGTAQNLDFEVRGGSVPGTITWELRGGQPLAQIGLLILSTNPGPVFLSVLSPGDPRILSVGLELIGVAPVAVFPPNQTIVAPPIAVPNAPILIDVPVHFQGLSLPGSPFFIADVSLPRAVRLASAGSFRDRGVQMLRGRSFFHTIARPDGTTILPGGGQGALFAQIATDKTEIYDPITDTLSAGPDMAFERSLHTATQLTDGRWLLVGGVDRNNDPQATAEIYDPAANTFTALPGMTTPRMAAAAARLPDGRVWVTGGITDLNAPNSAIDPIYSTTSTTEIYDPVANTWSNGPALRRPRVGHAAIARGDGRVQILGGLSFSFIFPTIERTTDVYDPAAGTVTAGSQMQTPRAGAGLASLGNGRWLLIGGVSNISLTQLGTPTATAEIFDEATGQFTSTGSMTQARAFPAVFELGGGRVAAAGGGQGELFNATALASTEIWDQSTGTFSAGPAMTSPRVAAGAYETATGQFHVIGGESNQGVTITTEFFYR